MSDMHRIQCHKMLQALAENIERRKGRGTVTLPLGSWCLIEQLLADYARSNHPDYPAPQESQT